MNTFVYCFLLSNLGVLSYGFIIQTHISQDEEVQLQAGIEKKSLFSMSYAL